MRHDEHYLQLIHRHIGLKAFSIIQDLPFFFLEVPDKWLITSKQADLRIIKELLPKEEVPLENMLPFPKFSFVLANDPSLHVVNFTYNKKTKKNLLVMIDYFLPKSYNYSGIPDGSSYEFFDPVNKKRIDRGVWVHNHVRHSDGEYNCIVEQYYNRKKKLEMKLDINTHPEVTKIYERNEIDMESLVLTILALFVTAEVRHERLVHVVKNPRNGINQRGNHHPSKYAANHHYVYLDGPPANILSKNEASGIKRRGHSRRAHWHRLMHDRFKNHPQFGQRIRIKASWIGPKEWADAGKIYTLHEPDEL